MSSDVVSLGDKKMSFSEFRQMVLDDYRLGWISRHCSVIGRKEVLTGKAKFGIFGDGKEVAQIAMAKAFKKGDYRSGYYRDQTFMMAIGELTVEEFFAQLYADPINDPHSFGRQMNNHFATHFLDDNGRWRDVKNLFNSASDTSPTSSQMPRALGLALASKLYRINPDLKNTPFSNNGNEVCFATIGDASCAEGLFWETLNAAGVMQVPLAIFIWDDGYGISVPKDYQVTKEDFAELLSGFMVNDKGEGIEIYQVAGWDYPALIKTFIEGIERCRKTHRPCVFHVYGLTQPQGHSTSGSHERYKPKERLQFEKEFDCLLKMREWILKEGIATEEELDQIEKEALDRVREGQRKAWKMFKDPIYKEMNEAISIMKEIAHNSQHAQEIYDTIKQLQRELSPLRKDVMAAVKKVLRITRFESGEPIERLRKWKDQYEDLAFDFYSTHLYNEGNGSALKVPETKPVYSENSPEVYGFQVLNKFFDIAFSKYPELLAFGEDVGRLGDVNQGFAGLQAKYGEHRIFDTGIREATIVGQAIGLAMRGFRPIAEIQYLDYLIFGLEPMTDDLATLRWRTKGRQKAPVIIRTRGHRLEGIWHTGSPIQMLLGSLHGMYLLVPRDMTRAAGMYNTILQSDEPALIIECLNGYRLREKLPDNIGEYTIPLGIPEVLKEGEDITIVTYGSMVRIVMEAAKMLEEVGISAEVIDVQTLIPFDLNDVILNSLKKTNRVLFADEDVPGGATAYMLQKVIEERGGYWWLDSPPATVTAKEHRSAYGSDGDYFCKPNPEEVFEAAYKIMHETDPASFPMFF